MNIFKSDEPVDISEHMLATYQSLRVVLCIIALLFPWVLWIGGYISNEHLELQPSMSDYYHAGGGVMRDWFVGGLFSISGLLFVYKGYRPAENLALNLAAVLAVLVALFPNTSDLPFHGIFAVCFFLCIAYVCIFCASATLPLVKEDRRVYYRRTYKLLGYAMVISPVIAAILTYALRVRHSYIFVAEFCGVYAFAIYWIVKTKEISETHADRKAAQGELLLPAGEGASDAIREMPVIDVKRQNTDVSGARIGDVRHGREK
ncbi:MAG TPA: hypothetical protein VK892_04165 [Pyrinomonadaceae bacterium]|nr:hypothetical protein [Pyrinomonadaceae bacterium]